MQLLKAGRIFSTGHHIKLFIAGGGYIPSLPFFPSHCLYLRDHFLREVFQRKGKGEKGHFTLLNQTNKKSTVENTSECYNLSI